jgi:hypothetical protein
VEQVLTILVELVVGLALMLELVVLAAAQME